MISVEPSGSDERHASPEHQPRCERSNTTRFAAEALHVGALLNFALAQPIFELLANNPKYLEDQFIRGESLVWVALVLSIAAPILVVCLEAVVGIAGPWFRNLLHRVIVCGCLVTIVQPFLGRAEFLPGIVIVTAAAALGVFATVLYVRYARVRLLTTVASAGIAVFPTVFLMRSTVRPLVLGRDPTVIAPLTIGRAAPIVMVVFDEFCGTSLMNDRREIDAERYPHFAALAADGYWFRNATTIHPRTEVAIPSILTGNFPRSVVASVANEHPVNLFTLLLSARDYELIVFEPYTRMYPSESGMELIRPSRTAVQVASLLRDAGVVYLRQLAPRTWRGFLPPMPLTWLGMKEYGGVEADRTRGVQRYPWNRFRDEQFDHFLRCIGANDRPMLYFLHIAFPHHPWCYLPSGSKYLPDTGEEEHPLGAFGPHHEMWPDDELLVQHAYQRYLLQVGYTDRLIGRLVERLKSMGLYEQCLLIVTADHGVSFRPNRSRREPTGADQAELPDILSVPLFVKVPHQSAGVTSDRNVEPVDLLPTIFEVLDAHPAPPMDGRSVVAHARPQRPNKSFFDITGQFVIPAEFDAKHETLDRMLAQFGSGNGQPGLFGIGPNRELIGRRLDDLDVRRPADIEIVLQTGSRSHKPTNGNLASCYISGWVRTNPNPAAPLHLAAAVKGTIRAVTRTYQLPNLNRYFAAMLPEELVRDADKEPEVYVVSSAAGKPVLRRCTIQPPDTPIATLGP